MAKPSLDGLRIDRRQERAQPGVRWLPAPAAEVRTVVARAAQGRGAATVLNASGYVTARQQATGSARFTGRVTEALIEDGMEVEEGQVLARLDDPNLQPALALARSLEARLQRKQADVEVAARQVDIYRQQLQDSIIRAPFAGVVVAKNAQPGEMISPVSAAGGFTRTGIGTIVDMASLEIEIDVERGLQQPRCARAGRGSFGRHAWSGGRLTEAQQFFRPVAGQARGIPGDVPGDPARRPAARRLAGYAQRRGGGARHRRAFRLEGRRPSASPTGPTGPRGSRCRKRCASSEPGRHRKALTRILAQFAFFGKNQSLTLDISASLHYKNPMHDLPVMHRCTTSNDPWTGTGRGGLIRTIRNIPRGKNAGP